MKSEDRIKLALTCRDCEFIPKVEAAGMVLNDHGKPYQVMHNGVKVYCDSHYGGYNVEVISGLRGHHEPQEEAIFHEVLKRLPPGSEILELGAFWGYYSLWFLEAVNGSKATLVEPVPSAIEAGRRNFQLNGADGRFVHAAIGNTPAPAAPLELWRGKVVDIETHSVDSLMQTLGIAKLGILHSDIQGHEVQMLHGAKAALAARAVEWVFISTHGENIHQRCLQILRAFGYQIMTEHSPGESFSVDGLIVAAARSSRPLPQLSRRMSAASVIARIRATLRVRVLEPLGLKPITS